MKFTFGKQLVVFLLVFTGTCGLIAVDQSCSEALERSPFIGITLNRTSQDTLTATGFGGSFDVNLTAISQQWQIIKENGRDMKEIFIEFLDRFQ